MVYKECNIGSSKPSNAVLEKYPHHLINHVSVEHIFSVANFYDTALQLIKDIHAQDKIPLMVGGSMMYFNLLKNGISSLPSADKKLREKLKQKIVNEGVESLYEHLFKLDPEAARQINSKDSQRIIRAIEIIYSTGKSIDVSMNYSTQKSLAEKYHLIEYGIYPKHRGELHQRIEERQDSLIGDKLINEIESIHQVFNISDEHPAMKAINYRQGLQVINGQIKKSELFERSLYATRQLAKRQCTWMKKWEGLQCFDLGARDMAYDELKKQLNLL
jgi:tRNA dimethylallyltransferase